MSDRCERWGSGQDQCLRVPEHTGPCATRSGATLPDYAGFERLHHGKCQDCGESCAWPFDYCQGCLRSRFGGE